MSWGRVSDFGQFTLIEGRETGVRGGFYGSPTINIARVVPTAWAVTVFEVRLMPKKALSDIIGVLLSYRTIGPGLRVRPEQPVRYCLGRTTAAAAPSRRLPRAEAAVRRRRGGEGGGGEGPGGNPRREERDKTINK